MAIVSRGDKVVYSYPTGDSFTNGEQYEVCEITDGYIVVIDKNGKARQYNYNIFISVFSLPNTLQVSQAKEDVRSYNVGQSDYSKHKIQPWDIANSMCLTPREGELLREAFNIIQDVVDNSTESSRELGFNAVGSLQLMKDYMRSVII